jgi:hypothetical protein
MRPCEPVTAHVLKVHAHIHSHARRRVRGGQFDSRQRWTMCQVCGGRQKQIMCDPSITHHLTVYRRHVHERADTRISQPSTLQSGVTTGMHRRLGTPPTTTATRTGVTSARQQHELGRTLASKTTGAADWRLQLAPPKCLRHSQPCLGTFCGTITRRSGHHLGSLDLKSGKILTVYRLTLRSTVEQQGSTCSALVLSLLIICLMRNTESGQGCV